MNQPASPLHTAVVSTVEDLSNLWGSLMGGGGFGQRTLWLLVLDDAGRPLPVAAPIEGLPRLPTAADVRALQAIVAGIAELGEVAMLISRPGASTAQEDDRRWGRSLTPLTPEWPVHLATTDQAGGCRIQRISP